MRSFPHGFRALVIGASGGIGAAFAAALAAEPRCGAVEAIHRRSAIPIDYDDEASIASAADALAGRGPFSLILHCVGMLHSDTVRPEKRLADLTYDQLMETFKVNAFGPALMLRHFVPLLARERAVVAMLSARVGSIGDNRLGGWTGYRASKAALNMIVRTAAIEVARTRPYALLVALHPGTVATGLSRPYRGDELGRPAAVAARAMLDTLDRLTPADTGGFYAYNGEPLPW